MAQCEKCGSDAYDNRQKVNNGWKGPLFKCKDNDCGWVKWPPKNQQRSGGTNGAGGKGGNGKAPRPLGPLYFECMRIAAATVKQHCPNATPQDIVAATATLFIGANDTGYPLRAVKAAPPPPKPEPEPEPQYEEETYESAGSLPF